ncbi:MAG: hypothetical protein ACPLSJ_06680 [Thermosulfidibacteraceae bacterium]
MLTYNILNIILNSTYTLHIVGERSAVRSVVKERDLTDKLELIERKSVEVSEPAEAREAREVDKRRINIRV